MRPQLNSSTLGGQALPMNAGFMHKYYDWAAFEGFIKELHEGDGEVTVERDVTEVDRYGAKRQTDVKITRRTRFHRVVTLVECKRWKEPVSRDRIDVLAASIEALGAQNGAIFTTTGFEEGAIAYAKGKGIELFVVRDLTPEEWGLPGRHIDFFLHIIGAEFRDLSLPNTQAIALIEEPLTSIDLGIHLGKDLAADPEQDLFSLKTGHRGPNLVGILGDAHGLILQAIAAGIGVFDDGAEAVLEITAACEIDFTGTPFRQLRLQTAAAKLERIRFRLLAQISQSRFQFDRGAKLDFAVVVESYISEQRLLAHRKAGDAGINFRVANTTERGNSTQRDVLENGSVMKVFLAPWVGLDSKAPPKKAIAGQLILVRVDVVDGKPQLALEAVQLPQPSSGP
jgi:hypothetical protein